MAESNFGGLNPAEYLAEIGEGEKEKRDRENGGVASS